MRAALLFITIFFGSSVFAKNYPCYAVNVSDYQEIGRFDFQSDAEHPSGIKINATHYAACKDTRTRDGVNVLCAFIPSRSFGLKDWTKDFEALVITPEPTVSFMLVGKVRGKTYSVACEPEPEQ